MQKLAEFTAEQFGIATTVVAEKVMGGASIKDLVTPIDTMGNKIGELTSIRYDKPDMFTPPSTGDAALNATLRDITNQMKNTNEALSRLGF